MSNYDNHLRMRSAFKTYKKGISIQDIALIANVSKTTVIKWITYIQSLDNVNPITSTSTFQEDLKVIKADNKYALLRRILRNLKRYTYKDKFESLTYEDLANLSLLELRSMHNIGERSIEELKKLLIIKGINTAL